MNTVKSLAGLLALSVALPLSANAGTSTDIIKLDRIAGPQISTTVQGVATGNAILARSAVVQRQAKAAFQVLYKFKGKNDGYNPEAGPNLDQAGNLYTAATYGGEYQNGTAVRLSPDRKLAVLHPFSGMPDGSGPANSLLTDGSGDLYGTTVGGGTDNLGAVYEIAADGTESIPYSFTGGNDGSEPLNTPILDSDGNLYGTTYAGGQYSEGTVFKLGSDGTLTPLHAFESSTGDATWATLVLGKDGYLYGTTQSGGTYNDGVAFRLGTDGTRYSVLYAFPGGSDGAAPTGGLIEHDGNLYGTTFAGGAAGCYHSEGCGVIYELTPSGGKWSETVLYSFTGGSDGGNSQTRLAQDKAGNLYGFAEFGGGLGQCYEGLTCGTVYRLAPDNTFTLLHACNGEDCGNPIGDPVLANGYVYGTGAYGGDSNCDLGCGTIFRVKE